MYCDFYSTDDRGALPDFVNALETEIELCGRHYSEEEIETVYIGGGTPSILPPRDLGLIFNALRNHFTVKSDAEITLEANPGTVSLQTLAEYRSLGANRLSIGFQSFNDDELSFLFRIHSADDNYRTFDHARQAGFSNVGIDLIYALPGQTINRWHDTMEKGVALIPEHISAYSLTIEEGTPLARLVDSKIVSPLPDDAEALFFTHAMEFLRDKGYVHYEISNYAKPDCRSQHNMNYWNHVQYLGFGPSAHSFRGNKRWWNVPDVGRYIGSLREGKLPVENSEELSARQLLDEMIMLGLRTGCLDLDRIVEAGGSCLSGASHHYMKEINSHGLITREKNVIKLTDRGYLFCDEIIKRLSALC